MPLTSGQQTDVDTLLNTVTAEEIYAYAAAKQATLQAEAEDRGQVDWSNVDATQWTSIKNFISVAPLDQDYVGMYRQAAAYLAADDTQMFLHTLLKIYRRLLVSFPAAAA